MSKSSRAPHPAHSSIYDASYACRQRLQECVADDALMAFDEWPRKRLADFNLWSSDSGALTRERASLDERLAERHTVRSVLIDLLCLLEALIAQCKFRANPTTHDQPSSDSIRGEANLASSALPTEVTSSWQRRQGHAQTSESETDTSDDEDEDDSDEDDDESHDEPTLQATFQDVEATIVQLVRISIAIRRSGNEARLRRADRTFDASRHAELKHFLSALVSISSLGSNEKQGGNTSINLTSFYLTEASERLIEANLRRRHRFLYARRRWIKDNLHNRSVREGQAVLGQAQTQSPQTRSQITSWTGTLAKPDPEPVKEQQEQGPNSGSRPSDPPAGGVSSLITSSVPTALEGPIDITQGSQPSVIAPSSTSSKVFYPKPPKIKDDQWIFRCPCCYQTLPSSAARGPRWRRHLAEDMLPYTCVLDDCPKPENLYLTRQEWAKHMQEEHETSTYWLCTACVEPTKFDREQHFVVHLQTQHHEEISADLIPDFLSMSKYTAPLCLVSCPLCPEAAFDGDEEVDPDNLLNHVAEHVHSFTLNSLPWLVPGSQELQFLGLSHNDCTEDSDYFAQDSGSESAAGAPSSLSEERRQNFEMEDLPEPIFQDEIGPEQADDAITIDQPAIRASADVKQIQDYVNNEQFDLAEDSLTRLLGSVSNPSDPYYFFALSTATYISHKCAYRGRPELAMRLLGLTVELEWANRQTMSHRESLALIKNRSELAKLYNGQGSHEKARLLLSSSLDYARKELGSESENLERATIMDDLAKTGLSLGMHGSAVTYWEEALNVRKRELGPTHPVTQDTMERLASTLLLMGRSKEAEKPAVQVYFLQQENLGRDNPQTLASMARLGLCYGAQRRYYEAAQLVEELLPLCNKHAILPSEAIGNMEKLADIFDIPGRETLAPRLRQAASRLSPAPDDHGGQQTPQTSSHNDETQKKGGSGSKQAMLEDDIARPLPSTLQTLPYRASRPGGPDNLLRNVRTWVGRQFSQSNQAEETVRRVVGREHMKYFKQAWSTYAGRNSEWISPQAVFGLLKEFRGNPFDMSIHRPEYSIRSLLKHCYDPTSKLGGVNLPKLNELLSRMDVKEVRKKRSRLRFFSEELLAGQDLDRGISYEWFLAAWFYNHVTSLQVEFESSETRNSRREMAQANLHRKVIMGFFDTLYHRRIFLRHLQAKMEAGRKDVLSIRVGEF